MAKIRLTSDIVEAALPAGVIMADLQAALVETFRYQNVKVLTADEVTATSALGSPIFMPFRFERISYSEVNNGKKRTLKVPELTIAACIVTVNIKKLIVKTFVQRQQVAGSFKEHINFGDYDISLKGILCNDDAKYPRDLVRHLNEICKAPIAIDITHTILNDLGIKSVVIEGGGIIEDIDGKQNMQPFSLEMTSDISRELIIR